MADDADLLRDLLPAARKRTASRTMSDLLTLPEKQQTLLHWMMRKGEVGAAAVAEEFTDRDEPAAAQLLEDLAGQGFLREMRVGGTLRYRTQLVTRAGRQLPKAIWQALYDRLTDVFDSEGTVVELHGNHPLALTEAGSVWMVRSGRVNVFGVGVEAGEAAGARTHLFDAEPGNAIFGLGNGAEAAVELIGLGTQGTVVRRLDRSRLVELFADPRHTDQVVALVSDWVSRVQSWMPAGPAPREVARLQPGADVALAEGAHGRTSGGVLWLSVEEGSVRVAARPELTVRPGDGCVPIGGRIWISAVEPSHLRAAEGRAWLATDPGWSALDGLHRLVLTAFAATREAAAERELQRITARRAADRARVSGAVLRLASVIDPDAEKAMRAVDEASDPLLAVCRLVGQALGFEVRPAARSEAAHEGGVPDRLAMIARASRVRMRHVLLRGDWWRQDAEPLVGYRDGRPVALLPDAAGRYLVVDPVSRTRMRVTRQAAESIDSRAVLLYRSFPARVVRAIDLFRFGGRGVLRDGGAMVLFGVAAALIGLLTPVLTGVLFNSIIPGRDQGNLAIVVGALVVSAFASAAFEVCRGVAALRVEGKMSSSLQAAVWDRLLALPVSFFRRYSSGDLAFRAMGIDAIRQILTSTVTTSLMSAVFSVFSWLLLFYYDARLALMATLVGLFVAVVGFFEGTYRLRLLRREIHIRGRLTSTVVQLVSGIAKLRAAGAEGRAYAEWARDYGEQAWLTMNSTPASLPSLEATIPVVGTLVVFAAVAAQGPGSLSTGAFLAFIAAFNQFISGAVMATSAVSASLQVVPFYERAKGILEALPEADAEKLDPGPLSGAIEVSHVSFRYGPDAPPVLRDISLHVRPGQLIAVVGPSGTGKSTLFRLLLGFDGPESGSVYYDGQDLATLDVRSVRRQIGAVMQNGSITTGSVFENIVGNANLTLDDAWEAARMVGLDDDIRAMPMGMQTFLVEGGSTLSGGQRQRLMIARSIVGRPRILLFDEATSALDNRTQSIVSRSLEGMHATRIVIAHRLSTVISADTIYVLSGGQIVQSGTYEELMAQRGLFQDLARRQLT